MAESITPALPPRGFRETLRQLGPGIIVSGSIVGSGELIAATTLGAQVGFAALWLIVVSCVVKVAVQEQLGRYTISTGETSFEALNRVPGPRWRASWVVWCWMAMFVGVVFQLGGIMGGLGQVFHLMLPALSVGAGTLLSTLLVLALLLYGSYRHVERASTFMVVSFTTITLLSAGLLAWTPYPVRAQDLWEGLQFQIPPGGLAVAFAAFGITGVGATELIYYPYWCLEKGYARFVGRRGSDTEWLTRARCWIRIMRIDALVSMGLYTVATVAFYLLGASVLSRMEAVPAGYGMVGTLSNMYTQTLGPWAFYLFLVGAFFVLYSTAFSATASNARVVVDFVKLVGFARFQDDRQQVHFLRQVIVILCLLFFLLHTWVGEPVLMVIIGGTAQASMLPVISFSSIYLRYRHLDPGLRPRLAFDLLLWTTSTAMLAFALYRILTLI